MFSILPDSTVKFACVYLYTISGDREIPRYQWARSGCCMSEHGVIIDWGNRSDRKVGPLPILFFFFF